MTIALLAVIAVLSPFAGRSIWRDAKNLHAYRRGWTCFQVDRCSIAHTYRLGCLWRNPAGR